MERYADQGTYPPDKAARGEVTGRVEFRLATVDDDAELRQLFATTPMPGTIAVTFRREPSFCAAAQVEGPFHQTIVACDAARNLLVAAGSRSIRDRFVNGQRMPVGYLSGLRILPEYRNRTLLARGYRFLRELHADGRTPFYLTTIVKSNARAVSLLTSGRAGLPRYRPLGTYHTLSMCIPRQRRNLQRGSERVVVRTATESDVDALVEFLQQVGSTRQFFPCVAPQDFFRDRCRFRGLKPSDLMLAFRSGRLAGTLGAWDQNAFRQTIVEQYNGMLKWIRPIYNVNARICGRPPLPMPGTKLRCVLGTLALVADDDPEVFTTLLQSVLARSAGRGYDYFLVGMHASDRLLPYAKRFAMNSFVTNLYSVSWEEVHSNQPTPFGGSPYLELGAL